MLEATATWMEEQVTDDVDDNRQYLVHGQLGRPAHPARHLRQRARLLRQLDLLPAPHPALRRRRGAAGLGARRRPCRAPQPLLRPGGQAVRRVPGRLVAALLRRLHRRQPHPQVVVRRGRDLPAHRPAQPGPARPRAPHLDAGTAPSTTSPVTSRRCARVPACTHGRLRITVDAGRRATAPSAHVVLIGRKGVIGRSPIRLDKRGDGIPGREVPPPPRAPGRGRARQRVHPLHLQPRLPVRLPRQAPRDDRRGLPRHGTGPAMTATGTASTATKGTRVRSILVLLTFLTSTATALALVPVVPATAADDGRGWPGPGGGGPPARAAEPRPCRCPRRPPRAPRSRWPAGCSTGDARTGDPSATVALRDLWMARPDLTGAEAVEAEALLARPTDGAGDPFGNGYTVPSTRTCGEHVCVHHVPSTADAPPSADWVNLTLATLENTYAARGRPARLPRPARRRQHRRRRPARRLPQGPRHRPLRLLRGRVPQEGPHRERLLRARQRLRPGPVPLGQVARRTTSRSPPRTSSSTPCSTPTTTTRTRG